MNPGGLRADLLPCRRRHGALRGPVRGAAFRQQPGDADAQRRAAAAGDREPVCAASRPRVPLVSRGFGFTWDAAQARGRRVVPGSMRLDGRVVQPGDRVRVTVNSFMAGGGDGYNVLGQGTERQTGVMDVDAFEAFVQGPPGAVAGGAGPHRAAELRACHERRAAAGDHPHQARRRHTDAGADRRLRAGPDARQLERRPGRRHGHGHPAARHGHRRDGGADRGDDAFGHGARLAPTPACTARCSTSTPPAASATR